jgi:uncharacterized SAM-binding protein YcdF (DUF218 family)
VRARTGAASFCIFWRSEVKKATRFVSRLLAAIGLLFVVATLTPINNWWANYLAGPWNDPAGEVLVVLGGDTIQDSIGLTSYWRSVYAVRVWKQGSFRTVVVCGGSNGSQPSIAEQMRDFMVSQGIPAAAIQVEAESRSTHENAVKSKPLLDQLGGKKVLLTSDYHMFRAYRAFRKAGIDIQPGPFPDSLKLSASWAGRWPAFLGLCTETTKIAYYFVRGWI